jgi:DUF2075 family protein
MHDQIGDSLAESEREVVVVIEQIDTLNAKTSKQREHIARSVKSAGDLTENTQIRVENNRGLSPRSRPNWRHRPTSLRKISSVFEDWPATFAR